MIKSFDVFILQDKFDMKGVTKKHFNKIFSPNKKIHSLKVRDLALELDTAKDTQQAALLHDFIENGGDKKTLKKIVTKKAAKLVKHLTNNKDEDVLKKLKKELKNANKTVRDKVIKIKLADRADNFNKKLQNGRLTNKYIDKTSALVNYLYKEFSNPKIIKKFIQNHFLSHKELKKKIKL